MQFLTEVKLVYFFLHIGFYMLQNITALILSYNDVETELIRACAAVISHLMLGLWCIGFFIEKENTWSYFELCIIGLIGLQSLGILGIYVLTLPNS